MNTDDITISVLQDKTLVLSTVQHGQRFKMKYQGYTRRDAARSFKRDVREYLQRETAKAQLRAWCNKVRA